jgi:hypothetical protein
MNKYKLEIQNITSKETNYIYIYADSEIDAFYEAGNILYDDQNSKYKVSDICLVENNCIPAFNYDTIASSNIKEDTTMTFFNVNWNDYIDDILKIAAPEEWSNNTYPDNGILVNYMVHTFRKLKSEKNIIITKEYGLFNTGLFTQYYEPIYAYSDNPKSILFVTEYDLGRLGIEKYPERANYFDHPDLLLFDWHYKINIYYKHILEDNKSRINIPKDILESQNLLNTFNGAIDNMKK